MPTQQEICEVILWDTSRKLSDYEIFWLPTRCQKCEKGMISNKMGSAKLICLGCGAEFKMVEAEKP